MAADTLISPRQTSREALKTAAGAALLADAWIGAGRRRRTLKDDFGVVDTHWQDTMLANHRLARRLPSHVPQLLAAGLDRQDLMPWLESPGTVMALCRRTGAIIYAAELARTVDRSSIATLVEYLGADVWRFAISNQIAAAPERDDTSALALIDLILAAGIQAVRVHLNEHLPEVATDLAAELGWNFAETSLDPDVGAAALRSVLAHGRI